MPVAVTFTTAPESYDGFGTRTAAIAGRTPDGTPIRRVETPERHARWQRERYLSGWTFLVTWGDGWTERVESGLVVAYETEGAA